MWAAGAHASPSPAHLGASKEVAQGSPQDGRRLHLNLTIQAHALKRARQLVHWAGNGACLEGSSVTSTRLPSCDGLLCWRAAAQPCARLDQRGDALVAQAGALCCDAPRLREEALAGRRAHSQPKQPARQPRQLGCVRGCLGPERERGARAIGKGACACQQSPVIREVAWTPPSRTACMHPGCVLHQLQACAGAHPL